MKTHYEVVVGNIGSVYNGTSKHDALAKYAEYVSQSKSAAGRAGNEDVTLMVNDEPVQEHQGLQSEDAK